MNQGAQFSEDRRYRYALWGIWNEDKPLVMFIGLNPSRANENTPDPTIRRVMRFAYDWGFGGLYMMNLFAWVTAYPHELNTANDPTGENDHWLEKVSLQCEMIVFAWGAFGEPKRQQVIRDRTEVIKSRYHGAYCIGRTQKESPGHPLFRPGNLKPTPFIHP